MLFAEHLLPTDLLEVYFLLFQYGLQQLQLTLKLDFFVFLLLQFTHHGDDAVL